MTPNTTPSFPPPANMGFGGGGTNPSLFAEIAELEARGADRELAKRAIEWAGSEPSQSESITALESLSRMQSYRAIGVARRLLEDEQDELRQLALVRAAAPLRDPRVTDLLVEVARNGDAYVSSKINEMLGERADPGCVPWLAGATRMSPPIRRSAVKALIRIPGPEASEALVATLEHGDRHMQFQAAGGLGERGDLTTLPAMEHWGEKVRPGWPFRKTVARAMVRKLRRSTGPG